MTDSQPPFDREISDQQLSACVHQELQQSTNFAGSEWRESIKQALSATPLHDWTSDGADALRTGGMAQGRPAMPSKTPRLGGAKGINRA